MWQAPAGERERSCLHCSLHRLRDGPVSLYRPKLPFFLVGSNSFPSVSLFLSSSINRFLKLSFHSVADLMEVKKALMPTIQVREHS